MIKVSELKGTPSYAAFTAYHKLMLGLKMLPIYMFESYEVFFGRIDNLSDSEKLKFIQEAAVFVKLDDEELEYLLHFCTDANGVPYSKENMKNLTADQFIDMIIAVSVEISKIKTPFVSEDEKKNSKISPLT